MFIIFIGKGNNFKQKKGKNKMDKIITNFVLNYTISQHDIYIGLWKQLKGEFLNAAWEQDFLIDQYKYKCLKLFVTGMILEDI